MRRGDRRGAGATGVSGSGAQQGDDWVRAPSGLYLRQAEAPVAHRQQDRVAVERSMQRATWFQVVVAVAALAVSAVTWNGQRELNNQQGRLNREANRRNEQVYAARVAVWATIGSGSSSVVAAGLDVTVQNRAPVPLFDLQLVVSVVRRTDPATEATAVLGELFPCTSLKLRLVPPDGATFEHHEQQWRGYPGVRLVFSDTSRRWRLDHGALTQLTGTPGANSGKSTGPVLTTANTVLETLNDCSEAN